MINIFLLIIYTILLFISIFGYGLLFNKIISLGINKNFTNLNYGEIGLFSLGILIPLSIITHLIIPINFYVSIFFFLIGLFFCISKLNLIKDYKKLLFLFLLTILFLPYLIINTHHDDFYYYHLPYLNVVQFSKAIFGLANLNNVLTYPQNLWFNVFSLFRLPIIDYNGLQIINGIFTIFFIIFCFSNYFSTKKIEIKLISLINIVFVFAIFSRLKDHGAEIIPQLLMLVCIIYCLILVFDNQINKKEILIKIAIMFTISILLRLSSIIILPLILFIFILNFSSSLKLLKKTKLLSIILTLVILVITKNIINSGCVVYPLSFTCFSQKQISWSIDKEIPKINENVILSFTRGWMIYAKENSGSSNKFIFNPKNDLLSHEEYLSKGKNFWLKYWIKDPDIIRILNCFIIGLFIFMVIIIENFKYLKMNLLQLLNGRRNITFLFLFFSIMFWLFLSTPSTRYGGYAIFIGLITFIIIVLTKVFISEKIKLRGTFVITILLSFSFFYFKNIERIEFDNQFNAWPEKEILVMNTDYKQIDIGGFPINARLATNKLLMGELNDKNNYILHCGNIKGLCTPIKKINCISKIYKNLNYIFIINNKEQCINLHSEHALY